MGLDACVYCDCFERGLLNPPGRGEVLDDGSLHVLCSTDEEAEWTRNTSCAIRPSITVCQCKMELASVRIGNMARVAHLRDEIGKLGEFKVMLGQLLENAFAGGTSFNQPELTALATEIEQLDQANGQLSNPSSDIAEFVSGLRTVVAVALRVNKPMTL
jgi:hypothetical protein